MYVESLLTGLLSEVWKHQLFLASGPSVTILSTFIITRARSIS
jgi:hypothetical protein